MARTGPIQWSVGGLGSYLRPAEVTRFVYGDHPLLSGPVFKLVTDRLDAGMDAAILGFIPANPTGYGRFITEGERLLAIREHKDASEDERKIGLCNACILAFRAPRLNPSCGAATLLS